LINFSPFKALFKLIRYFKKHKIDVIHANGSRVCLYAGISGKILKIPSIWHVRETLKDFYWYDLFLGIISSRIICVSKSVQRKRFSRFGKFLNKKIVIIYNGVDTEIFKKNIYDRKKLRKKLGLQNQLLLGIVGNFVPLKGQDIFIKGFADAKSKYLQLNAKVLLVGRTLDSAYYESLIKLAEHLNLKTDIIFKPYSFEIIKILSALDVFALPSIREGFNRSILEAMSCSLPIIATKISAIEEAITNNKNGLLFDPMNIEQISKAIIKICTNESMRHKMGKHNQSIVDNKFNLLTHVKNIESFYSMTVKKNDI